MLKKLRCITLTLLAGLLFPLAVAADAAPDVSNIGTLQPVAESPVALTRELVQFTIPLTLAASRQTIPATATFWLSNSATSTQKIRSIFPLYFEEAMTGAVTQYAKNVRVRVDGKAVASQLTDGAYPARAASGQLTTVKDSGYAFSFSIPARKTVAVTVTFAAPVGETYNGSGLSLHYLLASGAGWHGKIGQADIQFVYPFRLKSQWIALEQRKLFGLKSGLGSVSKKISGARATWHYKNFEPNESDVLTFDFVTPQEAKKHPGATALGQTQAASAP